MGHCKGGPHMESNKQEKYNLMHDNPVAKHASGGSWMSKHSKSALHFNAPKHNHTHPKGDAAANTGHTGNVKTTRNTSKKNIEKAELGMSMKYSPAKMGHSPAEMGHESPAEMHGGFHPGDAAKAFAGVAIKTAKKVKAAGKKIVKAVAADLGGGSERKRKLRMDRGGAKPAKVFKK